MEVILTKNELEELFYDVTVAMLGGITPADVRMSWPTEGAPAWGIDNNVTFLKVVETPSSMTVLRDDVFSKTDSPDEGNMETSYTRTLQVSWSIYGPNSWDNATYIRNRIFYQEFRNTLAQNNIYPNPDFNSPRRVPELFQGLWYERVDLTIFFNELIRVDQQLNNIESVEIRVYDRKGLEAVIEVDENSETIIP